MQIQKLFVYNFLFLHLCSVNIFNKDLVDLCTLFICLEFSTDQKNYKRLSELNLSKRFTVTLQSLLTIAYPVYIFFFEVIPK